MKRGNVDVEKVFMYNYFSTLGLQPIYNVDLNVLEDKYIELSRKFHPDVNDGKCENIIKINKAYEILKSPLKRAEHLLDLSEVRINTTNSKVLNESIEVRESLLDCNDMDYAIKMVDEKIKSCIKNLIYAFNEKNFSYAAEEVLRLKYLYKAFEEVRKNAANSNL
ncbi:MAG: Fe-S protein assembly co-chaperone HscB [Wolbachia endosymbiont of Fragariocoptes setiger]|nr:Fe-S protein assembly co-chaperone HscB [Wolbachia endosymbiont of Fragariocoptes setiger]